MQVYPYLDFNGRCEEALNFYRSTLGAEVLFLIRFRDGPAQEGPLDPPGVEDKIMHCTFKIGESVVMASDGMCQGTSRFEGVTLNINLKETTTAIRIFDALAEGGQVELPLTKTFFSPSFGMLHDRFGVSWMVHVESEHHDQ